MNLQTLNTHPLSAYGGGVFDCRCGRTHAVRTAFITAGCGTIKEIGGAAGRIVPPGSTALLVSTPSLFERFGADAERLLRRAGYLIRREILGGPEDSFVSSDTLDGVTADEDVRLLIGVGGGQIADASKYLGKRLSLPVFLIATSPATAGYLSPDAEVLDGGLYKSVACPPPRGLLCDYELLASSPDYLVASGFGELTSRLLALFDWRFASIVRGESYCRIVADQIYWAADTALKALDGAYKGDRRLPALLAELNLRLSATAQLSENNRAFGGCDRALGRCLRLLFRHEGRRAKTDGENALIWAVIAVKVYRQVLESGEFGFLPPPDDNLRQEKLGEAFCVAPTAAAGRTSPYPSPETRRLIDYRLREYRAELTDLLTETESALREAYRVFKRLYADDGYSLTTYLDPSDARLCLALAPDLDDSYTLLTQMKHMGLLEKFL